MDIIISWILVRIAIATGIGIDTYSEDIEPEFFLLFSDMLIFVFIFFMV